MGWRKGGKVARSHDVALLLASFLSLVLSTLIRDEEGSFGRRIPSVVGFARICCWGGKPACGDVINQGQSERHEAKF